MRLCHVSVRVPERYSGIGVEYELEYLDWIETELEEPKTAFGGMEQVYKREGNTLAFH